MDKIGVFVGVIAVVFAISFLLAYPVMLLWNGCLVPAIPVVKEVTWLQMWGLHLLFSILFKDNLFSSKK